MRDEATAGAASGVLDVEHLVIEDVLDGELRDIGTVHAAVQQNVIGAGIVAAELAAPSASAPSDMGTGEFSFKVFRV